MYQYKYVFAQLIAFLPINHQLSSCGHKKRDLPKRTGPFHYIRVMITSQLLPARQLTGTDYQYITANPGNIWETTNFLFRLKEKWMEFNVISLGLSLDVLICIIWCCKPKSGD